MTGIQENDSVPGSELRNDNHDNTAQEIYEVGEAQNPSPNSNETALEGQILLTQQIESAEDSGLNSHQINENTESVDDLDGALTQGGTTDSTKTNNDSTARVDTKSTPTQDWGFDPSLTWDSTPYREDLIVHMAYGLDNLGSGAPRTPTPNSQGQNPAGPTTAGGASGSVDPNIPPYQAGFGIDSARGTPSTGRASQLPQRYRDNLPSSSSSSSHNPVSLGSLNSETSHIRQRLQRPGEVSAERASNTEPGIRITLSRIEAALATLATKIATIDRKVDEVLPKNATGEPNYNQLDVINSITQASHINLTKIVDILGNYTTFQETTTDNFRTIITALENHNNQTVEWRGALNELNNRMHNANLGLRDLLKALQGFIHVWDVNRRLVNSYQELILSLVTWLEPPAIFFRNLGRIFGLLAFWLGLSSLPFAAGNQDFGNPNNNEDVGGGEADGGDGADNQGPDPGQEGGEQQPPGNQAPAQPAPGQYGSPFRADGLPWQAYNPGGSGTPPTTGHSGIQKILKVAWSYFLLIFFLLCVYYIIAIPSGRPRNRSDTALSHIGLATPIRGAYPIAPAVLVLLQAQNDARVIAELASKSAENVVACANLTRDDSHERAGLFKSWFGKWKKDPEGNCKRAASLSTEAAMKGKILAVRLDWVFEAYQWLTGEAKASKTEMGSYETGTAGEEITVAI